MSYQPPSNQMALDGLGTADAEKMQRARKWAALNRSAFEYFISVAQTSTNPKGASPNLCLQMMRANCRVKVPTDFAAYLARIALEGRRAVKFNLRASKADAYTQAVL